jgi:2-polyprenyl-3-methyl-5-hydroxy-6-metoxy-1,4-benzoquinol methylase
MSTTQNYENKPVAYFSSARQDIEPLLPASARRVLEVGCGTGTTLQWLKQARGCEHAVGVEMFEHAAQTARQHADQVVVGNAEMLIDNAFDVASFDLILCLDVLEHMVDPWAFVAKAQRLLVPGGTFIASLPNVRHLAVLAPLLLRGRWRYSTDGILDRTHLRFFTRESAIALLDSGTLSVTRWQRKISPLPSKSGLANLLTLGLAQDFLASQYLVAARRIGNGANV